MTHVWLSVWWIGPFVTRCLLGWVLQTAKAEEEEEEGCVCIVLSSNYLVILTSVFVAEANFTNSFHLTLQSPVIWSSDKTGSQTSVTADCLRLLTLSTWTQTKPVLNCSVKNKSYLLIYFSLFLAVLSFIYFFFLSLIVLFLFCREKEHPLGIFYISSAWSLNLSCLWLVILQIFWLSCPVLVPLSFPGLSRVCDCIKPPENG